MKHRVVEERNGMRVFQMKETTQTFRMKEMTNDARAKGNFPTVLVSVPSALNQCGQTASLSRRVDCRLEASYWKEPQ